jgi:hypothetical protein
MDSNLTWIKVSPTPQGKEMFKDSLTLANLVRIVVGYVNTPDLGG